MHVLGYPALHSNDALPDPQCRFHITEMALSYHCRVTRIRGRVTAVRQNAYATSSGFPARRSREQGSAIPPVPSRMTREEQRESRALGVNQDPSHVSRNFGRCRSQSGHLGRYAPTNAPARARNTEGRSSTPETQHAQEPSALTPKARQSQGPWRVNLLVNSRWAWVELNYRPHAYQAASYEHELGSEVPTRLPFTNILLSISRI